MTTDTKPKKITDKDFKKVEGILKAELAKRKTSQARQKSEKMWKVVDRQVGLEPMDTADVAGEDDWMDVFELGVLAQASEIMTADLLRVVFPESRAWFEAHVEPPVNLDPTTGDNVGVGEKEQNQIDGRVRAMMTQQHQMFGLRDRVELSIKEALHHGAFVAEIDTESLDMYHDGTNIKEVSAPVWRPHSMWNCWPDQSPSVMGSSMYYTGSMFVRYYQAKHKFIESATGEGWIKGALKKIPVEEHKIKENETKDLEIIVYWGDVVIPKSSDGMVTSPDDLYFPNYKAILANGKLVYLDANKTPYPPIIYKGYEKMDVRDPYAMSPIIKQSPMQTITSILANEFVNSVKLNARPPIVYDGNDPDFVVNGGPVISPGAKTSSKGSNTYEQMKIGDPGIALKGVEFGIQSMKEALGRPGITAGDRATAAEITTKQADSEAGPFGFAVKMDAALCTFLYMQHALNLADKTFKMSFYNPELDSPDFIRIEHKDLPPTIHFEVVGSKGMLGEARRHQAFTQTTAFVSGNPLFAPLLKPVEIVKQMYQDAGIKGAERFLQQGDEIPAQVKMQMQQLQQAVQQLQQQLKDEQQQSQVKLNGQKLNYEAKMVKTQSQHANEVADLHMKMDKLRTDHERDLLKIESTREIAATKTGAELKMHNAEMEHKVRTLNDAQQLVADKAIAHIKALIKDFEHKIEMLIALEKKEQASGLSDAESAQESKLTDNLVAMHDKVMAALGEVAATLSAPKQVVRDESGRIIGVEMRQVAAAPVDAQEQTETPAIESAEPSAVEQGEPMEGSA